jgi:hypothetical protein
MAGIKRLRQYNLPFRFQNLNQCHADTKAAAQHYEVLLLKMD